MRFFTQTALMHKYVYVFTWFTSCGDTKRDTFFKRSKPLSHLNMHIYFPLLKPKKKTRKQIQSHYICLSCLPFSSFIHLEFQTKTTKKHMKSFFTSTYHTKNFKGMLQLNFT